MVSASVIVGLVGILMAVVLGVMSIIYGMKNQKDPKSKDSAAWFGAAALSGILLVIVIVLMLMSHVSSDKYKGATAPKFDAGDLAALLAQGKGVAQ